MAGTHSLALRACIVELRIGGILPPRRDSLTRLRFVLVLLPKLHFAGCRDFEALAIGERNQAWIMELVENIKQGDTATYQPYEMPDSGMGVGLNDVPRGSLGHWVPTSS